MKKRIYKDAECATGALDNKTIAIIGYGSQGHAHALNLKESGYDVIVGLYDGSGSWSKAEDQGLTVKTTADAVKEADLTMILVPDELAAAIFTSDIKPNLKEGSALSFAHGFNIHYGTIKPPSNVDVIMIAPKGPGHTVRSEYVRGHGVPALFAIEQDYTGNAQDIALAYGAAIGSARGGLLETTFREETETDLFGEQAVLCGGVSELMKAGFEILVEAGYSPENAYYECMHEMKLIVDLVYQGGLSLMRYSISDTAEFGDYSIGKRIITDETRKEMRKVLKEIQNGEFARAWINENQTGRVSFNAQRRLEREHQIEKVGEELRGLMSWSDAIDV